MTGTLSLAVNQFSDLCGIHKPGGEPLCIKTFALILKVAEKHSKTIIRKLEKALATDFEEKQVKRKRLHYRYSSKALNVEIPGKMPMWKEEHVSSLLASPVSWSAPPRLPPQQPIEALLATTEPLPSSGPAPHTPQMKSVREADIPSPGNKEARPNLLPCATSDHCSAFSPLTTKVASPGETVSKLTFSSPAHACEGGARSDDEDSDLANAVKKQHVLRNRWREKVPR